MNERNDVSAKKAFSEKAKTLFDESVDNLDGETRSRLNRGRHAALAQIDNGRTAWMGHPPWIQWAPAGGVAAAAVLAVVLWTGNPAVDELASPAMATDIEILLTEDSLEMLEDLEFYSWIELSDETDESMEPANNVG